MKTLFTITLSIIIRVSAYSQTIPPVQQVFCGFIAAFNRQDLNAIYETLSPSFQATIDRAVCTGGLAHIYRSNGVVQSAAVSYQATDEGAYYVQGETGVFKVLLTVDSLQRIDGLRIQQIERDSSVPMASLFFKGDRPGHTQTAGMPGLPHQR